MNNDAFATMLLSISTVFDQEYRADGNKHLWFVSFGTLLYFLRDKPLGRPFNTDFDISCRFGEISADELVVRFSGYGYCLKKKTVSDVDGRPFQMVFAPDGSVDLPEIDIDVFFWVGANGFMWHCYDFYNENKNIPTKYVFKGIPYEHFPKGVVSYSWDETANNLNFPEGYGGLLDDWYPPKRDANDNAVANTGWIIQDRRFGQSKAEKIVTLNTCKNMFDNLK